jgi:hypothetical protein
MPLVRVGDKQPSGSAKPLARLVGLIRWNCLVGTSAGPAFQGQADIANNFSAIPEHLARPAM